MGPVSSPVRGARWLPGLFWWSISMSLSMTSASFAQDDTPTPVQATLPFRGAFVAPGQGPVDAFGETNDNAFEYWWFLNGERVLDLRRRLVPAEGSAGWSGYSRVSRANRDKIIATLLEVLEDRRVNPGIESQALIALAKTKSPLAREVIERRLDHSNEMVARDALIALGILADPASCATLEKVATGKGSDPLRTAAVLALGLLDDHPWPQPVDEPAMPEAKAAAVREAADEPVKEPSEPSKPVDAAPTVVFESSADVRALAWHPDGSRVHIGTADGSVLIWPTDQSKLGVALVKSGAAVTRIALGSDDRVAVGHADGHIRLRNKRGVALASHGDGDRAPLDFAWHPSGDYVVSADGEDAVTLWSSARGTDLRSYPGHRGGATAVAFSPDGEQLLTGAADGNLRVFTREGDPIHVLPAVSAITGVAWSPDGAYLAAADVSGRVFVYEQEHLDRPARPVLVLKDGVRSLAFSSDAGRLVVAGKDGLRVLDVGSWRVALRTDSPVVALALHPRQPRLAVANEAGRIDLYDLPERSPAALARDDEATAGSVIVRDRCASTILTEMMRPDRFLSFGNQMQDAILIAAGLRRDVLMKDSLRELWGKSRKLNQQTQGFLVGAWARIATPDDAEQLWKMVEDDNRGVRSAAAIGFGVALQRLGSQGQPGEAWATRLIDRRLNAKSDDEPVKSIRYLLTTSLGRVGGAATASYLSQCLDGSRGTSRLAREVADKPFWAYSLGETGDKRYGSHFKSLFDSERSVHVRAALAMGNGMLKDPKSAATLRMLEELEDTKSPQLITYLSLGLALSGATDAVEPLREKLADSGADIERIPAVAVALALLGDDTVQDELIAMLDRRSISSPQAAALLYSLGLVGDDGCVDEVIGQLGRHSQDSLARAYVLVALGELCDPEPLRRTSLFRVDHNYIINPAQLRIGDFLSIL